MTRDIAITHEDGTPLTKADADAANAMFCSLPVRARRLLEEVLACTCTGTLAVDVDGGVVHQPGCPARE